MTSGEASAADARAAADRSSQFTSSVYRSTRMLVSTRTDAIIRSSSASLAASEGHQFVRGHRRLGRPSCNFAQTIDDDLASAGPIHRATARFLLQHHESVPDDKAHFGVGLNAKLVPDLDGNGDLALAGYSHTLSNSY